MKSLRKPFYKQLIELWVNIQSWDKIWKFKKKKWEMFIKAYNWSFKRFWKFWAKDPNWYLCSERSTWYFSYQNKYKNTWIERKKLKLFYGHLTKKYLQRYLNKKHIQKCVGRQSLFLDSFERRLDTILYRVKFAQSVKSASQLVRRGQIVVNYRVNLKKSYSVKLADRVAVNKRYNFWIWQSIFNVHTQKWPIPPKYLVINYTILEFILGSFLTTNLSANSFYGLNLEKLINSHYH